jgi:predicted  nucleic acid-binding Zn-ribbon protein
VNDDRILEMLLELKTGISGVHTRLTDTDKRLERLENRMREDYANKDSVGRLEDRIKAVVEKQSASPTAEAVASLLARIAKMEDRDIWLMRGLVTTVGTVLVSVILFTIKRM